MTTRAGGVNVEITARIEQLEQGMTRAKGMTEQFDRRARQTMRTTESATRQTSSRIQQAMQPAVRTTKAANDNFRNLEGATRDLERAGERLSRRLGPLGSALSRLGPAGLAAGAALAGLTAIIISGSRSLLEYETNMLRIQGVLQATGHASGVTARQIEEFARRLEVATLTSRDEVLRAAAALATFRSVSGETFTETLSLAQDMSSALGIDLVSSTRNLARALEDPAQGMMMLRRVGVVLTASQQELIRSLGESGRQMEAQRVLLDEIGKRFRGVAEREAAALAGSLDNLSINWRNLREEIARNVGATRVWQGAVSLLNRELRIMVDRLREPTPTRDLDAFEKRLEQIGETLRQFGAEPGARMGLIARITQPVIVELQQEHARISKIIRDLRGQQIREDHEALEAQLQARLAQAEEATSRVIELEREATNRIRELTEDRTVAARRESDSRIAQLEEQRRQGADVAQVERAIAAERRRLAAEIDEIEKPLREQRAREAEAERERQRLRIEGNEEVIRNLREELRLLTELSGVERDRERFVSQAVARLRDPTPERVRLVRELANSLFNEQKAQEAATEAQREAERVMERVRREYGQVLNARDGEVASLNRWRQETLASLDRTVKGYEEFAAQVEAIYQERLPRARDADLRSGREALDGAKRFLQDYIEEHTNAAQRVEDAFRQAFDTVEDTIVETLATGRIEMSRFAEDIHRQLLRIAVRQAVMMPLARGLQSGTGPGGFLSSFLGGLFHSGGIVGQSGPSRAVPPAALIQAPRMHSGGIIGRERVIIANEGEEVLTESNPRHRRNFSRGRDTGVTINIHGVTDADSFRRSEGQIAARIGMATRRAMDRDG